MSTPKWHTREESGLLLDRQLRWWHDGVLVEHPRIIEAFNQGIQFNDDGRPTLVFGNDWCFFEFEKFLFTVTAVDVSLDGRLSLRLSDRTAEWLDIDTLTPDEDQALCVEVKQRRAWARFSRAAQMQLAPFLVETPDGMSLQVCDNVMRLKKF
jgi:uncharacterized protein